MRIAFDIGGVISKYPDKFLDIMATLWKCDDDGHEIFVITDMHNRDDVIKQLRDNGFSKDGFLYDENIICADYAKHGELCKAVVLRDLKIDMLFDDFMGYLMWPAEFGPAPIRCLVMPDARRPYWAPEWKCNGGDFGRRVYVGEKE